MNKATNDASASSSELTSQLNDLTGRVDSAREAVDTLIDKAVNGFDIGTQTINITNLNQTDRAGYDQWAAATAAPMVRQWQHQRHH